MKTNLETVRRTAIASCDSISGSTTSGFLRKPFRSFRNDGQCFSNVSCFWWYLDLPTGIDWSKLRNRHVQTVIPVVYGVLKRMYPLSKELPIAREIYLQQQYSLVTYGHGRHSLTSTSVRWEIETISTFLLVPYSLLFSERVGGLVKGDIVKYWSQMAHKWYRFKRLDRTKLFD